MQSPPLSPPTNSILVDRRADSQFPMANIHREAFYECRNFACLLIHIVAVKGLLITNLVLYGRAYDDS